MPTHAGFYSTGSPTGVRSQQHSLPMQPATAGDTAVAVKNLSGVSFNPKCAVLTVGPRYPTGSTLDAYTSSVTTMSTSSSADTFCQVSYALLDGDGRRCRQGI